MTTYVCLACGNTEELEGFFLYKPICRVCGAALVPAVAERKPTSPRSRILTQANALTSTDRNAAYGDPTINHQNIANLFTAYLISKYRGNLLDEPSFSLRAEDAAWFQVLVKIARTFESYREDNYIDAAAYAAIAGEAREEQEKE